MADHFYFEAESDSDNTVLIYANDRGGLNVSVSDVQAYGSLNEAFTCSIELDEGSAISLRDYLNRKFKSE